MQDADGGVKHAEFQYLVRGDGQQAAHQHFLDVLGALRRAIDHEHGGGGGGDIKDADEGFLPHAAASVRGLQSATMLRPP